MARNGTKPQKTKTQSFYDRIAEIHNITLKLNGYRASVAKFLHSLDLKIDKDSTVLDAGCGTGLVTLGFYDAGFKPGKTIALDLSYQSLKLATEQFKKERKTKSKMIVPVQGNVLKLPFEDETFDVVFSCGVLEYVPLDDGLREMSRVLKTTGRLIFIPVKPSFVGSVLEFLYNFKIHPLESVRASAKRYFNIIGNYQFPTGEPISWSKAVFLLEKK
ncbi:MAG: class I SAM-dependent methyltransferase [Pyrinomonadaceae bacterium]